MTQSTSSAQSRDGSARPALDRREIASRAGRASAVARRDGLVLTRDELEALAAAYMLLARAAERARRKLAAAGSLGGEEDGDGQ